MAHLNKQGKLCYQDGILPKTFEAYYVANWGDRKIMDNIISIHTGWMPWNWGTPNVMHVEGGVVADRELWFFSSTSRDYLNPIEVEGATPGQAVYYKNGTRWIRGFDLLKNPDRWIFTMSHNTVSGNRQRIVRANRIVGRPYAKVAVVTDFVNPLANYDEDHLPKKFYCSQAWHYADRGKVCRISPRRRYKLATKRYGYRSATLADVHKFCRQKH
jgi:hypothetical protein